MPKKSARKPRVVKAIPSPDQLQAFLKDWLQRDLARYQRETGRSQTSYAKEFLGLNTDVTLSQALSDGKGLRRPGVLLHAIARVGGFGSVDAVYTAALQYDLIPSTKVNSELEGWQKALRQFALDARRENLGWVTNEILEGIRNWEIPGAPNPATSQYVRDCAWLAAQLPKH